MWQRQEEHPRVWRRPIEDRRPVCSLCGEKISCGEGCILYTNPGDYARELAGEFPWIQPRLRVANPQMIVHEDCLPENVRQMSLTSWEIIPPILSLVRLCDMHRWGLL
jgi:hypothetical protein